MDQAKDRDLPIKTQAKLLGLNRSGLYYKQVEPPDEEVALKRRIDEIYMEHPYYGARRIAVQLQREGYPVGRKRVRRCMREMGIQGICPGPNLSKRNQEHRVYPYLLRRITPDRPNRVWGIDVTYISASNADGCISWL